jgi:hypothetical protein
MKPSPERIARVERLKGLLRTPLSDFERAVYNSQRAAEMQRAEARRQPTPQLPLEAAA